MNSVVLCFVNSTLVSSVLLCFVNSTLFCEQCSALFCEQHSVEGVSVQGQQQRERRTECSCVVHTTRSVGLFTSSTFQHCVCSLV